MPHDWTRIADRVGVAEIRAPADDRGVTSLTRRVASALVPALVAALALGCTPAREHAVDPVPSESVDADAGPPHFRGTLPVVLQVGRPVYSSDSCTADGGSTGDWVCDRTGEHAWLPVREGVSAGVVEARMDLVGGGTSWTVTVRFGPDDRASLHRVREQARRTGAAVVVLGPARQVLVAADVTRVEGRTISVPSLHQPVAWRLVEGFLAVA